MTTSLLLSHANSVQSGRRKWENAFSQAGFRNTALKTKGWIAGDGFDSPFLRRVWMFSLLWLPVGRVSSTCRLVLHPKCQKNTIAKCRLSGVTQHFLEFGFRNNTSRERKNIYRSFFKTDVFCSLNLCNFTVNRNTFILVRS